MGAHKNIDHVRFPQQGAYLNRRASVCFNYDPSHTVEGTIVRDDVESPHLTIIRLDDGRHVLSTECQYRCPVAPAEEPAS